jgi:alpha-L-rhamnosidase
MSASALPVSQIPAGFKRHLVSAWRKAGSVAKCPHVSQEAHGSFALADVATMNRKKLASAVWLLALAGGWLAFPNPAAAQRIIPYYLRCENQVDPLGIDEPAPRLSWRIRSVRRAEKQTACEIIVATTSHQLSNGHGDLWESGHMMGDETTGVAYRGRPLASGQTCYWKIRSWDAEGEVSDWSEPAVWTMGLLKPSDWRGAWIGFDRLRHATVVPAPFGDAKWIWYAGDDFPVIPKGIRYFMSSLALPANAKIEKAELLLAAQDEATFLINGQPIPASQGGGAYNTRLVDVTSLVKPGTNRIRVSVSTAATGPAGLIARLSVRADGHQFPPLNTDDSWRANDIGGTNWQTRPIDLMQWPAAQIIGPAGCAPWGTLAYGNTALTPPPFLRREFDALKPVQRATLYATALGLVDVYINGRRVSDDLFTPGWTDYAKRVYYRTYDVTEHIRTGRNAIGAILADGWYSGFIGWGQVRDHYGKRPRFRCQLKIEYADGSDQIISSGPEWRGSYGAVQEADFLMGEKFDARLIDDWDEPGFDESKWEPVVTGAEVSPRLQAHPGPPIRPFATLTPKDLMEPQAGLYVFDLGQNIAGVARLTLTGEPGQKITLRFGERLNRDGTVYTANLRGARSTDTYICAGHGVETWEPRLTYHGFQFVQVMGLKQRPSFETITAVAFSSATSNAGTFTCSDPMLNRLAQNTYWTQRANFMDIPTDCPQRDERLGWLGDAQVYLRAATFHEDVQSFFTKWLIDVADGQRADGEFPAAAPVKVGGDDGGPGWADAGVICPWTIYEVYGDKRILERHYDSMARYIEFCKSRSTPDLLPPDNFQCFGDWLNLHDETPAPVLCTAYFANSVRLMAQTAGVLKKSADAAKYLDLFERIKTAFNHAYVSEDGHIQGDTEAGCALALSFGLLDADKQKLAARSMIEGIEKRHWHLASGVLGTKNIMLALADIGRDDVAERLIHDETFPSWGYSIKQGATSIWERWDGWTLEKGFQDPGMNSFNHCAFGAVYQWMIENLGGIRCDQAGFHHFVIAPQLDFEVSSADTTFDSVHGPIESHWTAQGNSLHLRVSIPPNTTATVRIPGVTPDRLYEGDKLVGMSRGVAFKGMDGDASLLEVPSGDYDFWKN